MHYAVPKMSIDAIIDAQKKAKSQSDDKNEKAHFLLLLLLFICCFLCPRLSPSLMVCDVMGCCVRAGVG
jgi:hypothetical protein